MPPARSTLVRGGLSGAALVLGLVLALTVWKYDPETEASWNLIYWYGAMLILTAPVATDASSFFMGYSLSEWFAGLSCAREGSSALPAAVKKVDGGKAIPATRTARQEVGFWTLMPSAFITWIFAKSINNSAVLGGKYGILGGFAYAAWYVSFLTAGLVGYWLRTRHGFASLPSAVNRIFGPVASFGFGLSLLFRLWNEVWSNAAVVGGFYGEAESTAWWVAVVLSAGVPLCYVVLGGMYSSLISDALQALLGVTFLIFILVIISVRVDGGLAALYAYAPPPTNSNPAGWAAGGWELMGTGLLQGFTSYPFMDPVLTDRAFLSTPKVMLTSFVVGGCISYTFIVMFATIGMYGSMAAGAVGAGSPVGVGTLLGGATQSLILLVMMTSSLSTLDSTFTSTGKLFALELAGWLRVGADTRAARGPLTPKDMAHVGPTHVLIARLAMVVLSICSVLYLLASKDVLSATTVSGTVVMGLAPPIFLMLVWRYNSSPGGADGWRTSPLAFVLPWFTGVIFGVLYQQKIDLFLHIGVGSYKRLLGVNVIGTLACFGACALGFLLDQLLLPRLLSNGWLRKGWPRVDAQPYVEDAATGRMVPTPRWPAGAAAAPEALAAVAEVQIEVATA